MNKILTASIFVSFFFLAGCGEPTPLLSANPSSYDFGNIPKNGGTVSTVFVLKNSGQEPLTINRVSTSCGCTIAEMDQSLIPAGGERTLTVTYDPLVHSEEFGLIQRAVYIQNSDPNFPELIIDILGNVVGDSIHAVAPSSESEVVVFFNEACEDCGELVKETYPSFFAEYGYDIVLKDYINERENRTLLREYNEEWGVSFELQSHIEAFVSDKLLIGGHVPEPVMRYLLEHPDDYEKLLVYQDKMHGEAEDYKVWDFQGEIKSYPLDEPITTYLSTYVKPQNPILRNGPQGFWSLFGVISGSAFLDGLNPCAFAVLLFFIAFLFSMKRTRASIWKMGLVYIFAIYLAYFFIGIGIAQAIVISGSPHLMAKIGAYLVIALGVIQLLGLFFPRFPIRLRIPVDTRPIIEKWLYKSTLPASFVGGFVVGLCTFPCSGGIYVAVIGLLSSIKTYLSGLGWLLWYNLVFVSPLFILLALAGNPRSTEILQKFERKESRLAKFVIAAAMIVLGAIILIFFT